MKAEELLSLSNVSAFILAAMAVVMAALIANGIVAFTEGMLLVINILMALILMTINARLTRSKR